MPFRYRYAPFGTKFEPHPGLRPVEGPVAADHLYDNEVVVDVGGACWDSSGANRGVLDHHFLLKDTGKQPFPSAAAAVLHQASLIGAAYKNLFDTVWLVSHQQPDFDATCAMFLARSVIEGSIPADGWEQFGLRPDRWVPGYEVIDWFQPRVPEAPERRWPILLAAYAAAVDNCRRIRCPRERSLHSILYTARERRGKAYFEKEGAHAFFQEVADILRQSTTQLNPLNDSVLEDSPNFILERKLLDQENAAYQRDIRRARRAVVFLQQARSPFQTWFPPLQDTPLLHQDGTLNPAHLQAHLPSVPVDAIYLRDPECLLFKEWARTDLDSAPMGQGFLFTFVAYSQGVPAASLNQSRYFIAIDPERAQGRHLYNVWVRLQEQEVRREPPEKAPRDGFQHRARGSGNQPWPFEDRWNDPWFDGHNYEATIIDTPNIGTLLGAPGTAADLSDDPVAHIVQQELEYAVFASPFTVHDMPSAGAPSAQGVPGPAEESLPIHEVLQRVQPPPASCLRFAHVRLKADLATLKPGVARQVGWMLWTVLDPDHTEGRPEEVLDDHLIVDADTITVWSRRGVVIAEKSWSDQTMPRTTLYASQMSKLAELACGIDALLQTSSPQHVHEADVREGETLIRRVAQLKRDFAQPQARPLQRFLEASRLDEVLGMVRDVNTAQAFANNISSIVRVQRMMHLVEFFLVSVYAVELFHALAEGFDLHGQGIGWTTFVVAVVSGVLLFGLLEKGPGHGADAHDPEQASEKRRMRLYLIIMALLFLGITAAMSHALCREKKPPPDKQTCASKSELPPPQQHFIFTLFRNYFCTPAPAPAPPQQSEQTPKPRPAAPTGGSPSSKGETLKG